MLIIEILIVIFLGIEIYFSFKLEKTLKRYFSLLYKEISKDRIPEEMRLILLGQEQKKEKKEEEEDIGDILM